jgi:hypothetical protein
MRGRVRDGCSVQTLIGRVAPDVHTFVRRAETMDQSCDSYWPYAGLIGWSLQTIIKWHSADTVVDLLKRCVK